jgi:vanillate O-demethylase ferredoxin subunit
MTSSRPLDLRRVRVAAVGHPAIDVMTFDLESADGRPLAPFAPGAHIDVQIPGGPVRQYSLCGESVATGSYTIAVKKEPESRGGSSGLHERIEVGAVLSIGGPRNHFPLSPGRHPNLFIAGGIGITPITAMISKLHAEGEDWTLHYCARSERHAAFYEKLTKLALERVHAHFSETPILDANELVRSLSPEAHIYCCGPKGLMNAVKDATASWPQEQIHFEWFTAPDIETGPNTQFEVELAKSGTVFTIPPDQSILQVLRENGYDIQSACEEGICGTCETRVLAGEPEHRDALLSPAERAENKTMMICVSRAKSARLVLDL